MTGLFIVFEGADGAGKSTQVKRLITRLRGLGRKVHHLFEPTRREHGLEIRRRALNGPPMTPQEELDLFLLDRRQNVEQHILPALEAGEIVVQDRYYFSTAAYQGSRDALGLSAREILDMHGWAPEPDLTILLDVPTEIGLERCGTRGKKTSFETTELQRRVRASFLEMCEHNPRMAQVDATKDEDAVAQDVWSCVSIFVPG